MTSFPLFLLHPDDPPDSFPPVERALREPNGLLAIGGDLSTARLLAAYRRGIFPWYAEHQPIMWWSPDPRALLWPNEIRVSRSLRRRLRDPAFRVTFDRAFEQVIAGCAEAPRRNQAGTWITAAMRAAYVRLHALGHAHSVEIWHGEMLAGGLYDVMIGTVFCGESMFSRMRDASKLALVHLARRLGTLDDALIDCQLPTAHLESLGCRTVPRREFVRLLADLGRREIPAGFWQDDSPPQTP